MELESCKSIGCLHPAIKGSDFCYSCQAELHEIVGIGKPVNPEKPMSEKYPQYYKKVGNLTEIDVYAVHHLFDIQDPSGCIQHASKKLLLSGVRTGGKSALKDIKEARDTLTRWIQLNEQSPQ